MYSAMCASAGNASGSGSGSVKVTVALCWVTNGQDSGWERSTYIGFRAASPARERAWVISSNGARPRTTSQV